VLLCGGRSVQSLIAPPYSQAGEDAESEEELLEIRL